MSLLCISSHITLTLDINVRTTFYYLHRPAIAQNNHVVVDRKTTFFYVVFSLSSFFFFCWVSFCIWLPQLLTLILLTTLDGAVILVAASTRMHCVQYTWKMIRDEKGTRELNYIVLIMNERMNGRVICKTRVVFFFSSFSGCKVVLCIYHDGEQ